MKSRRNKKQTDAQKYNKDFEELSLLIIKNLLGNTNVQINKTKSTKDGGYDIVVEYREHDIIQKVYFECKLRSENLNLRDISANLIIAFNEGAVALVIITNYDYTEQTNENMSTFYNKTILNIKIIIGEDIQKICQISNLKIKDELAKIIVPKQTKGKNQYQFLRLDFGQSNFFQQIFQKNLLHEEAEDFFIRKIYDEEWNRLYKWMASGKSVFVKGLLGVGKTSLIKSVVNDLPCRVIHVIATNYSSQSQILLGIFLDVWGIPIHSIVQQFSDDIIDKIIKTIDEKFDEKKTGQIIRHLLGKTVPAGIADEHYNAFVCDYLIQQLLMHQPHVSYVFFLENTERATEEIQVLLAYIVKLFIKNKIGCIIEKNEEEYQALETNKINFFYEQLKTAETYEISMRYLKPEEARDFVEKELHDFPHLVQRQVLYKGGVRLLTLNILVNYMREIYACKGMHAQFTHELELFSPNDLPQPIHCILSFYYKAFPQLFHYFYLFGGKIPLEWLDELNNNYESIIDKLLSLKFLDIDDNYLLIANQLSMDIIWNFSKGAGYSLRKDAQNILDLLEGTEDILYIECKINAYNYLKMYDRAFHLIFLYMKKLRLERQYSSFIKYADMILENSNFDFIPKEQQMTFIISILETWVIKKEIHSSKANGLLEKFEILSCQFSDIDREKYLMIFDYFKSKKYFKNCEFHDSEKISAPYYRKYIASRPISDKDEWMERLCIVYALSIKELYGNNCAQNIFSELYGISPDSFYIRMEFWSHEACMHFYDDPKRSLDAINNILELHEKEHRENYQLPFHEYVDRAMCAFCAKDYENGLNFSNDAIRILEANGIIPTLGRAYNIKGCIMVCLADFDEAERCFKEACFSMDESNYRLYSWRSRLNLLHLEIIHERDHIANVRQLLDETYYQFVDIYQEKLHTLKRDETFITSREYFALLMFGQLYICLKDDQTDDIANTFLSEHEKVLYKKHIKELCDKRVKNTYFRNCSYAIEKYLFMVG